MNLLLLLAELLTNFKVATRHNVLLTSLKMYKSGSLFIGVREQICFMMLIHRPL